MTNQAESVRPERKREGGVRIRRAWLLRGVEVVSVTLAAALVVGFISRWVSAAQFMDRYPPFGERVDVGGYKLHIDCTGRGSPTVVMDAGEGQWSLFLRDLQDQIADGMRVCIYDRAGLGWSDGGPEPRTAERMADELHTLLDNAGEDGPFVLVGFSFAGWNAILFANRYPEDVSGLVLVATPYPDYTARLPQPAYELYVAAQERDLLARGFLTRLGVISVVPGIPEPVFPVDDLAAYRATMRLSLTYAAMEDELRARPESAAQVAAVLPLNQPVYTVTSGRPLKAEWMPRGYPVEQHNAAWMAMEEELGGVSVYVEQYLLNSESMDFYVRVPEILVEIIFEAAGVEHTE